MMLLGAFDPPTNAHVDILSEAARESDAAGGFCLTKVVLARNASRLLADEDRIDVLDAIAERLGFGLAFANRGTYLDVHRALVAEGFEPAFVVGSDKLAQLEDPAFYPDGRRGVDATFDELSLVVVPRGNRDLSATKVRRMVSDGRDVSDLVPPEAAAVIGGYTSGR